MSFLVLTFVLISCSSISYLLCRNRVLYKIKLSKTKPKSLPKYYGQHAVIWTFFPAFILLLAFTTATPKLLDSLYSQSIFEVYPESSPAQIQLALSKVKNIVLGSISSDDPLINEIANDFASSSKNFKIIESLSIVLLSMLCSIIVIRRVNLASNARYSVEKFLIDEAKSFAIPLINGSSLNTAPLTIFFTLDKIN